MNNIRPKTIGKKAELKEVISVTKQQRPNVQILRHDDHDRHIITHRHFSREHLQSGLKSVLPTYVDDNDEELLTQTSSRDVIITPRSDISHEFKENKGSTSRENDKWRSKRNAMAKSFKKPAVRAGAGTNLKCAVMDNKNAASVTNFNDPAHVANSIQKRIVMLSPRIDSFDNKSERPQVHKRVSRYSSYDLYKDTIQNQNIPKLEKLKWKTNSQYKIPSNFEEIKQELLEYAQSRKRVQSGREMAEETDVKMATKLSKVPIVQTMNKSVSVVEQDIVSLKVASVSDLESAEVLLSERMALKEIHQVHDVARQQGMSGDLDNDIVISNIQDAEAIDDRNQQLGRLEDGFIEIPNGNPEFVDSGICGQIATKFTHEIKSEVLVDEILLEPEYVDTEYLPRPAENSITARSHHERDRRETDNSLTGKERHEIIREEYEMLRPVAPSISLGQEDAIDLFFKSMAETVKSFPPKVIAEAKVKVCNLIGELEMRTLSE